MVAYPPLLTEEGRNYQTSPMEQLMVWTALPSRTDLRVSGVAGRDGAQARTPQAVIPVGHVGTG